MGFKEKCKIQSFKEHYPFEQRKQMSTKLRSKNRIPVIVQPYRSEVQLPHLKNEQYLFFDKITYGQMCSIIQRRLLQLKPEQTFITLINGCTMVCASKVLSDIYDQYKDSDGFLYVMYASRQTFG